MLSSEERECIEIVFGYFKSIDLCSLREYSRIKVQNKICPNRLKFDHFENSITV